MRSAKELVAGLRESTVDVVEGCSLRDDVRADLMVGDVREAADYIERTAPPTETFQSRVQPWMMECFGPEISADKIERNHRFLEEALEVVQANGCTESEARQLVTYVYGREQGDINQEVGGVMVTLAALCLAIGEDMHTAGEKELARIWTKVETIRAKQATKPKHSPLPVAPPADRPEFETTAEERAEITSYLQTRDQEATMRSAFGDDWRTDARVLIACQDITALIDKVCAGHDAQMRRLRAQLDEKDRRIGEATEMLKRPGSWASSALAALSPDKEASS